MADKKGAEEDEARLDFIFNYLQRSMRLKPDKWAKMMGTDDLKKIVMNFLEDKMESQLLIFMMNTASQLVPVLSFPSVMKTKGVYFMRKKRGPVTAENLREVLKFGDFSAKPLDELDVLVNQVYLPMLTAPVNQRGWPKVAAEDVNRHMHMLRGKIYEIRGDITKQTLLPMPLGVERVHQAELDLSDSNGEKVDLPLKSAVERIVVHWKERVDDFLGEDSSVVFATGAHATPTNEIEYWKQRLNNLECIYDQLCDPRVKKMASILEQTQSVYLGCFQSVFKSVVAALTEAHDINLYLKPLVKHFDMVGTTEFREIPPLLPPLMHCVCLLWANSRYYCDSSKIIVLMSEVCNLLIESASNSLDPNRILMEDVDEALVNVQRCIDILVDFRMLFEVHRNNLRNYFPKGVEYIPWEFHPKKIFLRCRSFEKRLQTIKDYFLITNEYLRLDKVEFSGIKGTYLSGRIEELFEEFNKAYSAFNGVPYDPLDPEDQSFIDDYTLFQEKVLDFDRRLAAIFVLAFDDCYSLDGTLKLIYIAGTLLERPIIKQEIQSKYFVLLAKINEELDVVKEIFDEQMAFVEQNGHFLVEKMFPPVAGALQWISNLRMRIRRPVEAFMQLDVPSVVHSEEAEYMLSRYNEMMKYLKDLETSVMAEWVAQVPAHCDVNLDEKLLAWDEVDGVRQVRLNFHPTLVAALREVRYMRIMNVEGIPDEATALFDRVEELHQWVSNLNLAIGWYNYVRNTKIDYELELMLPEIADIDQMMQDVIDNLNWNSDDVWEYVQTLRDKVGAVHGRLVQAQDNLETISQLVNQWNGTPLYERKDSRADALLNLEDRLERTTKRWHDTTEAATKIHELMEENFKLFHDIPLPVEEPPPPPEEKTTRLTEDGEEIMDDFEDDLGFGGSMEELPPDTDAEEELQKSVVPSQQALEEQAPPEHVSSVDKVPSLQKDQSLHKEPSVHKEASVHKEPSIHKEPSAHGAPSVEKVASEHQVPSEAEAASEPKQAVSVDQHAPEGETTVIEVAPEISELGSAPPQPEQGAKQSSTSPASKTLPPGPSSPKQSPPASPSAKRSQKQAPAKLSSPRGGAKKAKDKKPPTPPPEPEVVVVEEDGEKVEEDPGPTDEELEAMRVLQEKIDAKQDQWRDYQEYVDDIIIDGLCSNIGNSLGVLMENMKLSSMMPPLFEIQLTLVEPELAFVPNLDMGPDGFPALVESILNDISKCAELIPRVAPSRELPNYVQDMAEQDDLREMRDEIMSQVKLAMGEVKEYSRKYERYSYLWLEDRQVFLAQFLLYGHQLTPEEVELAQRLEEEGSAMKETPPTLAQFKQQIDHYIALYADIEKLETHRVFCNWLQVDLRPFKQALLTTVCKWSNLFKNHLQQHITNSLNELEEFIVEAKRGLLKPLADDDYDGLIAIMGYLYRVKERQAATDVMFEPLKDTMDLLATYGVEFPDDVPNQLQSLPEKWENLKKIAVTVKQQVAPLMAAQVTLIRRKINFMDLRQAQYRDSFKKLALYNYECKDEYDLLDHTQLEIRQFEDETDALAAKAQLFEVSMPEYKLIKQCRREIKMMKQLWDFMNIVRSSIEAWKQTPWRKINADSMQMECKNFLKELRGLDKEVRPWDAFVQLDALIKNLQTSLNAVMELQDPGIRDRHWTQLMAATHVKFSMDEGTTLSDLLDLKLHQFEEEVKSIVAQSKEEMKMEKILKELNATWNTMEFEVEPRPDIRCSIIKASEELVEILQDNQNNLNTMMSSKFIAYFYDEVNEWLKKLSTADAVITKWMEVQRQWMHLESIFIGSEDIRSQLPEDTRRFETLDKNFRALLEEMVKMPNVVVSTNKPGLLPKLEEIESQLSMCQKSLADYLETKRLAFPRFYFCSPADLLDILSNGNNPELVMRHLIKFFDSMAKLKFKQEGTKNTKTARGMWAKDGEYVEFDGVCECVGKVEMWLNQLTDTMRRTMRYYFGQAVMTYDEKPREQWMMDYPAQPALCGTQIWWTTEVNQALGRLEEGYELALKDYNKKQITQLSVLITLLLGDLTAGERQKIMTICTIDVHSRDVVGKMIVMKVESSAAFQWQSQLRHRWDEKIKDCFCNICDAQFRYAHEYLGNTPRLVITPLTDRCYITLTQSLHLVMGGAPAGPAGTGKTETTKDLGRAMGIMVYVFNCSEQMDYKSCGDIYKGLAQSGTWGCFDEFNRISVEVLSVVAVQVKSVLDGIKSRRPRFLFMGLVLNLIPTVGMFITMNPGYAGRTELPENLKALFRPCAMVVPDFELICEIMLVAEGFQEARLLARKFITLYTLCRELLSKQDHYDWGLRAIKSVLVVAGSLKRGDRERPEDQVLMRALRDFNVPKIVTDDLPIFMGLIGDLFPALDVPRKRDPEFEGMCRKAAIQLRLQPEENFVLKIVQLEELLEVRHSVFIVGNAGTGKTMVWRSLFKTYQNQGRKPMFNDLNPKAVTNDELFGVINKTTREWKDGLISVLMREQANLTGDGPKWLVLDGDIDPMWIESLNTVMDDNKVLTLASNERIALTKRMRLLFEIASLRTATPATVSRAGILYINPQDLGWNPYVASWIDTRENQAERANLMILFDKYVPPCLDGLRTRFKRITPIPEISHIQMLCHLLECLLTPANTPPDCPKEWSEIYFVFACVWAFGATLFQDQLLDHRVEFTKWWVNEFKVVKFPAGGTVFNYYIENETKRLLPWTDMVLKYELDYDTPLQSTLVSTAETTRLRYFMDLLIAKNCPVMLVGGAGSGKSVIVSEKLSSLPERYAVTNVPFNFYTTSEMLQRVLEKPLEKKAGKLYAPPANRTMIFFVDDINMPEVDTYGTVQPHTLMRQYQDYKHWYDRVKITLKEIQNCQFVACMNPTAGSFTINPRLQRHFYAFAVSYPSADPLFHIYYSVLSQHLAHPLSKFLPSVSKVSEKVVQAALYLHQKMGQTFLPTATKFHYIFNLRDLSNIFQGLLYSTGEWLKTDQMLIRLWMHEATRVYGDKLVDSEDIDTFKKVLVEAVKKYFEDLDEEYVFSQPLIYCHFAEGVGDSKYMPIKDWASLNKLLEEGISLYNDLVGAMNLVLFEDAMYHVCRISRIMEGPRGNALLVGVGGSGKQSLSRLAACISSLEVFQLQLRKGYVMDTLKTDFSGLYLKSGLKGAGIVFLMTDAQVGEENFLVVVNDVLASGEIPELFADDDVDTIINSLRGEVKTAGILDSRENCWKYFIQKVRGLLKIVLCFSPVGSTLRVRGRKFPALVNCTAIDWFHEWPQEALESVSTNFLSEIEVLPEVIRKSVSLFMAYVHTSVNEMSQVYLQNERRYNYTTPKSFLEQISLYAKLLTEKTLGLRDRIVRLENGLLKLADTAEKVDGLQEQLAAQEVVVNEKNAKAEELIKVVNTEKEKVNAESIFVAEEEKRVRVIEEDVSIKHKACEEDLAKAQPALDAAAAALDSLNKNNLTELKSFGSPPEAVVNVTAAVLVLFSPKGKVPKDRSWKACKIMMAKVDGFLESLIKFDKENIHPEVCKAIKPYIDDPGFDPDLIRSKSQAAAGLCSWVRNIMVYYEVYLYVAPKRKARDDAARELDNARRQMAEYKARITVLEEQLAELTEKFDFAMGEKMKCQAEADATATTIDLANRLVGGLASEKVRWKESVANFKVAEDLLPGDILLVTAFLSYVGCFTRRYRQDLQEKNWLPFLKGLTTPIPITEGADPLSMLTDDAQIAVWNNEGLPSDRMSAENATILVNSSRWPLMIDPQLQGIKWIKQKYGDELVVVRLGQRDFLDKLEMAISRGLTVLMEFIGETVDAVLDSLLSRALIKRGRVIRIGDKEIDYDDKFRLILHTKLANPHYQPEMQAQTTLINFTVTKDGLEDQLLAEVVKAERPDLEADKAQLTTQQNQFKITLKTLEDDLLQRLSSAGPNILEDVELVLNLEKTKKTAAEIEEKVKHALVTTVKIDEAREEYRIAASRASLLYFVLNDLNKINPIYQFSLKAFSIVFQNAIVFATPDETCKQRVLNLIDSITFQVFVYTSRGLFECDKLIFMAQMTIQILIAADEIDPIELDFLLRFPFNPNVTSALDFLSNTNWGGIKVLADMMEFKNLDRDIEGSAKRWKKFVESETPEREKFPQEWKNKTAMQRLCMMRSLRPDRMTYAVRTFVEEKLGTKYTEARTPEFAKTYIETSPETPVFFILSPGVDPLKDVEQLGKKLGFAIDKKNFHNVSLGQGQEPVAENAMRTAAAHGHWVILQNIHLVKNWLPTLEKRMEECQAVADPRYRLFMSAEPAPSAAYHIIPQGILESSIKITNEPPTGMLANLHKALDNFNQETLEMSTKEAEFKSILFALCYFHAVVAERRKFGAQGWNRVYPFNVGDLTISVHVLYNYLENSAKVPWEDLRYLFGEIMYGGHITDDWDRRLCRTYLQEYMQATLVEGEMLLAPGFYSPPNGDYVSYHKYVDSNLPPESPILYGLHPNAEINFLTTASEVLFRTVFEMQPRDSGATGATTITREEKVRNTLDDIADKLPEPYNMVEMMARVEDRTPYVIVAFQECERMNGLTVEMKRSLKELDLGLRGELTITSDMEALEASLFMDQVPDTWGKRAYPSMAPLGGWVVDLQARIRELEAWSSDFSLPATVWLAGFFNPQSFLTAIMQSTARKNEWPLDKMCLQCDVTKKQREDFTSPPREGAYIHSLLIEGARWDTKVGVIMESRLKELCPTMPVVFIKAITQDKQDMRNMYDCPVYKTRMRGPTFVWTFNLRTKEKAAKWTLAGVAILLQE